MRAIIIVLALTPSLASAQVHGQRFTHNSQGVAYVGGYYTYNRYTYGYDWHATPNYSTDNHSVNYSYTYNYNHAAANQGNSQYGLTPGTFRYDEADIGGLQYDSAKYVSAGRSVDERAIDLAKTRTVQSGYTRDKVARTFAKAQAFKIFMESEPPDTQPPVVYQSSEPMPPAPMPNAVGAHVPSPALDGIEAQCLACHQDGKGSNGVLLPGHLSDVLGAAADKVLLYVTRLDEHNCSKRARLTPEQQAAIVRSLGPKLTQQ